MLSIICINPSEWDEPFEQSFVTPVEVVVAAADDEPVELVYRINTCLGDTVFLDLSEWVCPKPKRLRPSNRDPVDTTAMEWVAKKDAFGQHCALSDKRIVAIVSELTGERMLLSACWVVDFVSKQPRILRSKYGSVGNRIKGVRAEFTGDLSRPEHMFIMH